MADLFDDATDDWRAEWVGMPEFMQEPDKPHQTITIRFRNAEDVQEFADLIGQRITPLTKSIWHPYKPHRLPDKKVWVDDE
jgi:hypothetical protein